MVRSLLIRGMLAGLLAGLLVFAFGRVFGEPSVDRAIGFEAAMHEAQVKADAAKGLPAPVEEPELVSRAGQASLGLLTGVAVYATAFGGLFALVFAAAYGRTGPPDARALAALLAAAGFLVVYLVPNLKYPANPPAVGAEATIGLRTALYFMMLLVSLCGAVGAALLRQRLLRRLGGWNAGLAAAGLYLAVVIAGAAILPRVDEVPHGFPADVLWRFRIAALGMQAVMWATIGLAFGWLAERALAARSSHPMGFSLDTGRR